MGVGVPGKRAISRTTGSGRGVGGRPMPEGARVRGWLVPGIPYSGLVPQGDGPPAFHARHPVGDVRLDVRQPCCRPRLSAYLKLRGGLRRPGHNWCSTMHPDAIQTL